MRMLNDKRDLKKKKGGEKANQNESCMSKEYLQLELPSCSFLLVQTGDFFLPHLLQLYLPSFFSLELMFEILWNIYYLT